MCICSDHLVSSPMVLSLTSQMHTVHVCANASQDRILDVLLTPARLLSLRESCPSSRLASLFPQAFASTTHAWTHLAFDAKKTCSFICSGLSETTYILCLLTPLYCSANPGPPRHQHGMPSQPLIMAFTLTSCPSIL